MAFSMSAFFASLSLWLVVANAGSITLGHNRNSGRQPLSPDGAEQEVVTREDILQAGAQQSDSQVEVIPPATQPALVVPPQMQAMQPSQLQQIQIQQLQQQMGVSPPPQQIKPEQLLQQQAIMMQQMQKQLLQQQQELQRLQQAQRQQPPQPMAQQQAAPQQPVPHKPKPHAHHHKPHQQPKKSLVGVNAGVYSQAGQAQAMTEQDRARSEVDESLGISSGAGSGSGSAAGGIARPKGWDQCLKFARFVKSKEVAGTELVRVWKSTCEPAVQSGRATERYKLMCNSLTGVVQPYASQLDYDVEQLCDSVLAVFHDVTATDAKMR